MNSDDITRSMTNEANVDNDTQPTITAVFRLLREVKQDVAGNSARFDEINSRLDGINSRLDATDSRISAIDTRLDGIDTRLDGIDTRLDGIDTRLDGIDTRLDGIDTRLDGIELRIKEGFRGLSNKLDALNKSRLQADGDYIDLLDRVTELESKAS
jgi:tetrahydromethanopterin S-methyltransferase subunit G